MRATFRIIAMAMAGACGGSDSPGTAPDNTLRIEARSLASQGGLTGTPVGAPPSVRLTRAGAGVAGVTITFALVSGDGVISGETPTSDANGIATIGSWKPGRYGVNSLTATASGATGSPVKFEAIADPGPLPPQARYSFADSVNVGTSAAPQWVAAGIRGDGRARDGQPLAGGKGGEYQGSFCGVLAAVARGDAFDENTNFLHNPARYWDASLPASCQPSRAYRVYSNGADKAPLLMHPLSVGDSIHTMKVGDTRIQTMILQGGSAEGAFLFSELIPAGSKVLITRLPDIRDELERPVRRWRIESRGTHNAISPLNLAVFYLPFVLTVTEVPYPFPTYP